MRKTLKQLLVLTIFIGNSLVITAESISAHEHAERTHNNIILILQTKNALLTDSSNLILQKLNLLNSIKNLLSKHGINSNNVSKKQNIKGYDYQKEKNINRIINQNSLVIPTNQVKGKLAEILLEPKIKPVI